MRLFVAVSLDPSARAAVATAVASLRRHPGLAAAAVKWVETGNLHLTLQFLGEVEAGAATAVAAALAPASPLPAFRIALGSFGALSAAGAAARHLGRPARGCAGAWRAS